MGVAQPFTPSAKAHPALGAVDRAALEALAARLQAAGYTVEWDDVIAGTARFYVHDPFGNRLELLASPRRDQPVDFARCRRSA